MAVTTDAWAAAAAQVLVKEIAELSVAEINQVAFPGFVESHAERWRRVVRLVEERISRITLRALADAYAAGQRAERARCLRLVTNEAIPWPDLVIASQMRAEEVHAWNTALESVAAALRAPGAEEGKG